MKKPDITHWIYTQDMECLLVFANLIDEITFNYTTDSYKAPALHAMSLIGETIQTLENIDNGIIREGALQSVIQELKWTIEHDELFKLMVSEKGLSGLIPIIGEGSSRSDLKTTLQLIDESISESDYLLKIKTSISDLVKENRQKEKIEKQTRIFVTHLKFMGYAEEYIYYKNKEFFLNGQRTVNNVNDIDGFLGFFNGDSVDYRVIHIVNRLIAQIQTAIVSQGGEVGDDFNLGINNNRIASFKRKRNPNWKFVTTLVSAKDPYSARRAAEEKISGLSDFYSFYHHKNTLKFQDVCMVVENANPNHLIKIKRPTPNIVRCKDLRPMSASRLFLNAVGHISMDSESQMRIEKSLKLHQAALTADSLENQFVNLFTAFEILIPKRAGSGDNRISQIYDTLIPYLCLNYYDKLISSVVVTLRQWSPTMLDHIEQTVAEGDSIGEKVCAYMLLQKYDNDLDTVVYPAMTADNYHLLRQRMYRLHVLMEKPSELIKHLKHHEQKLKWHIDRIYRTRNLIVHSGVSPHYLETLLENIHSYYDILITRLIYDNLNRGFSRLEYSYLMYDVEYKEYLEKLHKLQDAGDSLDENNFLDAVLLQK